MEPTAIEVLLGNVGSLVTGAISWMSSFVSTAVSTPLILAFAIIPMVGLGIGLLKRMLNVN